MQSSDMRIDFDKINILLRFFEGENTFVYVCVRRSSYTK